MTCTLELLALPVRPSRRFNCVGCLGPGPNNGDLKSRLKLDKFFALSCQWDSSQRMRLGLPLQPGKSVA